MCSFGSPFASKYLNSLLEFGSKYHAEVNRQSTECNRYPEFNMKISTFIHFNWCWRFSKKKLSDRLSKKNRKFSSEPTFLKSINRLKSTTLILTFPIPTTYRMSGRYMLKHMINCSLWRITSSIITPTASFISVIFRRTIGKTTAQRFVAGCIRTFFVIRIEMRIR